MTWTFPHRECKGADLENYQVAIGWEDGRS